MAIVLDEQHTGVSDTVHPHHARLRRLVLPDAALRAFFAAVSDVSVQELEYVPFMRFIVAGRLREAIGGDLRALLRTIVRDRSSGGFTVGCGSVTTDFADFVKFGTAISHLVGPANYDAMSGTYFARFVVEDTDTSDSYLRQAYRRMMLHTDGTFVTDKTDWLLMMKFEERNAAGGESRLLHLDDWEELDRFATVPFASHPFTYKSPPSKNVAQTIERTTFFDVDGRPGLCFIDQFVNPTSIEEATYLHDMLASMEASPGTIALPLPPGELVMLNNAFWAHGREAFVKHPKLYRELMRQRGRYS